MRAYICKNCEKEFENKNKRTFCSKGCATGYRSKVTDLNFMDETDDFRSYMVGMVFGDGCLSRQSGKKERLTIALKDKDEVESLRQRISPERKLYIREREPETHSTIYSVVNTNEEAIEALKNLGLTQRKTKTVELPILEGMKKAAFVRGYFDSNGCLYRNTVSGYLYWHMSITTGSPVFAEQMKDLLIEEGFNARLNKDTRHDAWYVKIYAQEDVLRFGEWLYEDAEFFLQRKKDLFDEIV